MGKKKSGKKKKSGGKGKKKSGLIEGQIDRPPYDPEPREEEYWEDEGYADEILPFDETSGKKSNKKKLLWEEQRQRMLKKERKDHTEDLDRFLRRRLPQDVYREIARKTGPINPESRVGRSKQYLSLPLSFNNAYTYGLAFNKPANELRILKKASKMF